MGVGRCGRLVGVAQQTSIASFTQRQQITVMLIMCAVLFLSAWLILSYVNAYKVLDQILQRPAGVFVEPH